MTKTYMNIWGRGFELNIYYKMSSANKISAEQKAAYDAFMKKSVVVDEALPELKAYIEKNYSSKMQEEKVSNIFKYAMPRMVFIPKQVEGNTVALMCDFAFDVEHGIALVFRDEVLKAIGSQDIVL